jgi:hypothetical protein
MGKLAIAKAIGKAALKVAGVAGGGNPDRVRALEAEKELVELRLQLAVEELDEERQWLDKVAEFVEGHGLSANALGIKTRAADIDDTLRTARGHV